MEHGHDDTAKHHPAYTLLLILPKIMDCEWLDATP